jgi:hypothetical protein
MFKKILIGLAAVLVILIVVIAMQPADFKIERQTVVAAPPEIVFGQVNDFRNWKDWSPWVKMDPAAERRPVRAAWPSPKAARRNTSPSISTS